MQVDQLFRKRPWFGINVSSFKGKTWGPFLESSETFRALFGGHNSLCVFKTKASRGAKFCSYLISIPFTTQKRPALLNKRIGVLENGSSSPKNSRDFRETGPCVGLLQARLVLISR